MKTQKNTNMKYLNGFLIKFGDFESNGKFHEEGGWVNGTLTNGKISFSVGGGWIHDQSGANHYNSCHGFSYSGGGSNPYKQALSAGGFESYKGSDLGDVHEVFAFFAVTDEDEREILLGEILKLNKKAWEDYDVSDCSKWIALANTSEEIISELENAIEYNEDENLNAWIDAAKLKKISFEVIETGETEDEIDEVLYKTVEREFHADGTKIAEWTICAAGWYQNKNDNPNYSIGWNVDENTDSGQDGISGRSVLYKILNRLHLAEEATEVPDIDEPSHEEENEDGEYIVEVRNPYTDGMKDWGERARFDTESGAKFYVDNFWREFYSANSANSYGPETRIMYRGKS